MVRKLTHVLIVTIGSGVVLLGQAGDANKVLADMRAALGGADKIAAVKTVTAVGMTQTPMGKSSTESQTTLAMALPDKYVVRRLLFPGAIARGPALIYRKTGFNGNGVINETVDPRVPGSLLTVRTPGLVWPSVPLTPEQRAAQVRQLMLEAKQDFARTALGLFGSSFEAFPVQFSYAGQEDLAEGKAHVIQVTGADKFDARLFVDSKTNLPLALTWTDLAPWVVFSLTRDESIGEPEVLRQRQAFEAQWDKEEAALKMVEYRVSYSHFKAVDGLNLPHTLTRTVDGKLRDTTTFSEIKINPTIDDSKFAISRDR